MLWILKFSLWKINYVKLDKRVGGVSIFRRSSRMPWFELCVHFRPIYIAVEQSARLALVLVVMVPEHHYDCVEAFGTFVL